MTAIAPLTSLQNDVMSGRRRDSSQPASVKEFLTKLCKDFDRAYTPSRLARYYQWAKMECYYRGQQLIWYNPDTRRLEYLDEDETELYFINNIILPFIEMISAEYTKSRPRFTSFSETGSNPKIRAAMNNANFLMESWSDTLWTPEELQRESKLIQFRSRVYTYTDWDENLGAMIEVPQFAPQQADFGEGLQAQYMAATQMVKRKSGGLFSKAIDPFKVKTWDRRYTPEESPYLDYEDFELDALLKRKYPHLNGKLPKKTAPDPLSGLTFLRQLETSIGNSGEADAQAGLSSLYSSYYGDISNMVDELTSIHSQIWFEPYVLDYVTGDQPDDVFGDGTLVIPPRTKLEEVFSKGMKLSKINGEMVAAIPHEKNAHWSGYLFQVTAASHFGVGSENLMAQQEWFTEVGSLIVSSAMYSSSGITVANGSKIKNGKALNRPGTVIELEDMIPGQDKLSEVIQHITTSGMDPVLMNLPTFLKESMQLTSGARSSQVSGLPGQGINTATGVNNMAATADSAAAMKLELRAQNLARRMEQGLAIFKDRQVYPRYFGRFAESDMRELRGLDVPYELRVRYEPDSHEPRTNQDKKQDFGALVSLLSQAPEMPPQLFKAGVRLFAPDLEIDDMQVWDTIGQQRLDAMDEVEEQATSQAAQLMQMRGVPEEMAAPFVQQETLAAMIQAAAPDPLLDNHKALEAFYRDFYASDAYRRASDAKKAAIHQLVLLHEQGGVVSDQKETAKQVAATQPAQEAQMAQAEQQQAMQSEQEAREGAETEAGESEAQQRQEAQSGAEREHQAGEADKQRQHERDMQESKQKHELEVAKLKKPTSESTSD